MVAIFKLGKLDVLKRRANMKMVSLLIFLKLNTIPFRKIGNLVYIRNQSWLFKKTLHTNKS